MTPFIEIKNVSKTYQKNKLFQKNETHALKGVSLNIYKGETLGLVGESGSGKTTLGKCLLGLEPITSGSICIEGKSLFESPQTKKELLKEMQVVFQDPYASLNPRMRAIEIVKEPLPSSMDAKKAHELAAEMLVRVGIAASEHQKYARDFSGGQRQRIAIARAIINKPSFILCDEPTSALDVSIQAQILHLLKELQVDLNLSYLFISHDLGVVRHICNRVAIMYQGVIVEIAPCDELFDNPQHPYTKKLLNSILQVDPHLARERLLSIDLSEKIEISKNESLQEIKEGHFVRC